jgi:hypothetical protein
MAVLDPTVRVDQPPLAVPQVVKEAPLIDNFLGSKQIPPLSVPQPLLKVSLVGVLVFVGVQTVGQLFAQTHAIECVPIRVGDCTLVKLAVLRLALHALDLRVFHPNVLAANALPLGEGALEAIASLEPLLALAVGDALPELALILVAPPLVEATERHALADFTLEVACLGLHDKDGGPALQHALLEGALAVGLGGEQLARPVGQPPLHLPVVVPLLHLQLLHRFLPSPLLSDVGRLHQPLQLRISDLPF